MVMIEKLEVTKVEVANVLVSRDYSSAIYSSMLIGEINNLIRKVSIGFDFHTSLEVMTKQGNEEKGALHDILYD